MLGMDRSPVTAGDVALSIRRDPEASRVRDFVLHGWPEEFEGDESMRLFVTRKDELSVEQGVVLWGSRVVIPKNLQEQVLKELHVAHIGGSKMKMLARGYVWWPKMDLAIEQVARDCPECMRHRSNPESAQIHPWEIPSEPWERIHLDYAGPFLGKMFLIASDAYSKWLDVFVTPNSTTETTLRKLRHTFAIHGIQKTIVSDNGSSFTSEEFQTFTVRNGIRHITSALYHPSTNGLAERSVQTFKNVMKKWVKDKEDIETKVEHFLFAYRNTPHTSTGVSPADRLLQRRPRTALTMIKPGANTVVEKTNERMVMQRLRNQVRTFSVGDSVMARNYSRGDKWIAGIVEQVTGPVSYKIRIPGGILRRHVDQLAPGSTKHQDREPIDITQFSPEIPELSSGNTMGRPLIQTDEAIPEPEPEPEVSLTQTNSSVPSNEHSSPARNSPIAALVPREPVLTRSSRQRRRPGYLEDYCC